MLVFQPALKEENDTTAYDDFTPGENELQVAGAAVDDEALCATFYLFIRQYVVLEIPFTCFYTEEQMELRILTLFRSSLLSQSASRTAL